MTAVEYEHPIRKVRDEIAAVVDRAKDGGAITYVTRNGERVAAVVPLPVADRGTRPAGRTAVDSHGEPLRPAPAAPVRVAADAVDVSPDVVRASIDHWASVYQVDASLARATPADPRSP